MSASSVAITRSDGQSAVRRPWRIGRVVGLVVAAVALLATARVVPAGGAQQAAIEADGVASVAASVVVATRSLGGVIDQPVPANLRPPLNDPLQNAPVIYADGCHVDFAAVAPRTGCVFGDLHATRAIALVGDSKAAQWFSALEPLARTRHLRLFTFTKSACTAASVTVWSGALGRPYRECDSWRQAVLARIAAIHPALVVVSDDRLYELDIGGRPVPVANQSASWDAGLRTTLRRLRATSGGVVLLSDTPRSRFNTPACLLAHLRDAGACATPRSQAIDPRRLAADAADAKAAGVRVVDPTRWVCPADPCPPIIGSLLVDREQDHLTAAFVISLETKLAGALGLG
jgi:hypothetical protein